MTYLDWLAQQDLETCTFKEAFQAGAASRDAEIAELKTVPMRYRRMAFNAQLQDEVAELAKERDQLRAELAAEQANNTRLRDFIASAQVSSGVCCCGEPIDGHSSPMSCGHSPVDMWDHAVGKLLDAPSDTSTPEQSLAEYRNKVIEDCAVKADALANCEENTDGYRNGAAWCAEAIRAMKEKP